MKKILILSLNFYPKYIGGAEVAIKELVQRLSPPHGTGEYEFHMLTLRFDSNIPEEEIVHGIHVHRIGFTKMNASISDLKTSWLKYNKYYFQLFGFFYIMNLHFKYRFSAVWAMMAHSCGVPAGLFKTFFPKVKYILTLQEGDPSEYIENLARPFPKYLFFLNKISFWFFKNAFVRADIVQSISTYLNDWVVRMGNENKKVVIPNGVDLKQFTRDFSPAEIEEVRDKLNKKEGEVWLVTTSRLVTKNGIDNVIQAVAKLDSKYYFAILGIGPEEEKYKKLANDLGVTDRVKFVGEIKHPLMATYLKTCDIFIRPSRSEGMGNSFVEAMAMRMPVIATREGGLSDFIFDCSTAFVCEKDNPDSIVSATIKIENYKKEGKLGKVLNTASEMVREKYDWDKIAIRMEREVFSEIHSEVGPQ